jgi:arginyl-tRNA--protein-N-Asp/Glu arginylyltransferase
VSAVYCYWDPELKSFSPGVYSVLKQLELCRAWGARHLYLGLYIAENAYMKYKADFRPHERLVGGRWQRFS